MWVFFDEWTVEWFRFKLKQSNVVSRWNMNLFSNQNGNSGTTGCLLPRTQAAHHLHRLNVLLARHPIQRFTGKLPTAKLQLISWYVILERNCLTCNFGGRHGVPICSMPRNVSIGRVRSGNGIITAPKIRSSFRYKILIVRGSSF